MSKLMTELGAVNTLLSAIGEAPVNTLEEATMLDVARARQTLAEASREIQEEGWHWNTERGLALAPTVPDGHLVLPDNTLRVDTSGGSGGPDLVQRGQRLYDPSTRSDAFAEPVAVDLVVLLDWDQLPQAARRCIAALAARQFAQATLGPDAARPLQLDEARARAALMRAESATADRNILKNPSARRLLTDRAWR